MARLVLLPLALVLIGFGSWFGVTPAHSWYGGNVVVTLREGRNLPQLDSFGAMGGETDAYVKVRFKCLGAQVFT